MTNQVYARATQTGKLFLELATQHSNEQQFKETSAYVGDFGYVISLKRGMDKIQTIRVARLTSFISEVERAAKARFGDQYRIREFVLIGD